jgi:phosphomannomutase / phosphoglucomutase
MDNPKLFGTSGIRGDAETFFTNEFCQKIGVAFGHFLLKHSQNKNIAIGMDPRPSSQRIKDNLIKTLIQYANIYDEGIVPTPCVNFFAKLKGFGGAVMITGSHVQENLNGLKFFFNGEEVLKEDEVQIENIYYQLPTDTIFTTKYKLKKENQAKADYQQMLTNLSTGHLHNLIIVIDAGNGTQSQIIPEVLSSLGAKVSLLNCNLGKPMLSRDTEVKESFTEIEKEVLRQKADLGIIYDADGDRVIFITESGHFLQGELSCGIIAKYQTGESIVTTINSSSVVDYLGKKVIRSKIGSPYVIEAMKTNNVNFGFESNGGAFNREINFTRDGGITSIKLLNIIIQQQKSLQQLVDELPHFEIIKTKVPCPSEYNSTILAKARQYYNDKKIEDLDGLKVWLDNDSWILFRPSGNAPEFRIFAESTKKTETESLIKAGKNLVNSVINNYD